MIRLPRYLDQVKLRDVAEYLSLPTEEDVAVQRRSSEGSASRIGINRTVDAGRSAETSEGVVETFQVRRGPVNLLNQVVLKLEADGGLIAAREDECLPSLQQRGIVELSGDLQMLPASEIAQYFDLMLPVLEAHGGLPGSWRYVSWSCQLSNSTYLPRPPCPVAMPRSF